MTKKQAMRWVNALRSGEFSYYTIILNDMAEHINTLVCDVTTSQDIRSPLSSLLSIKDIADEENMTIDLLEIIEIDNGRIYTWNLSFKSDNNRTITFDEIADCIQFVYVEGWFE